MRTVTLLGTGPLPIERDSYIYSSSNRTWQIARALLDAGHRVHVIAFRLTRVRDGQRIVDTERRAFTEGAFSLDSVEEVTHFRNDEFLRERIREVGTNLLVGVNSFPAGRACELGLDLPLWADMNGFNMGEVQIRAHLTHNDDAISHGWHEESMALSRADVFSSASARQRYALIGELAAIGRLRAETCGYEFVHVIPNGREDPPASKIPCDLRLQLGPDAFLALWVGCYNYQFDVETLFKGMDQAMSIHPGIHFVSTGGQVDGHNETTFSGFLERVHQSPHRDRYHFMGWLPWDEFDALLRACDVGVTMDIPCYETELGARNRLTEMWRVGLPAITTPGPEIAEDVCMRGAGWAVHAGEAESLAKALLTAANDRLECRRRGSLARTIFESRYTIKASVAPLVRWADSPWTAPDHGLPPLLFHSPPVMELTPRPRPSSRFWRWFGG